MIVKCPNCGTELEAPENMVNHKVQCSECNKKFIIDTAVCYKCGAALSANAKFCGKCGSSIQKQPSSEISQSEMDKMSLDLKLKNLLRNPIAFFVLGVILSLCLTLPYKMSSANKELYRLKYAANVECIDANGHVKGNTSLQARSVIAFVRTDTSESSSTRLKPSGMSCIEFKNTRPENGAVFKAVIGLSDYYNGKIRNYKDDFWSIEISLIGENERLHGYVYKDSECGKEIFEATRSGARVKCLIFVKSLNDFLSDLVLIEDFCTLN